MATNRPIIYYRDRHGKGTASFNSGSPPDEYKRPPLIRNISNFLLQETDLSPAISYQKGELLGSGKAGTAYQFFPSEKKFTQEALVVKTLTFQKQSRYERMLPIAEGEAKINELVYGLGICIPVPRPAYVFRKLDGDELTLAKDEIVIKKTDLGIECHLIDPKIGKPAMEMITKVAMENSKFRVPEKIEELMLADESDLLDPTKPFQTKILDELCYLGLVPECKIRILMKLIEGQRLEKYLKEIKTPIDLVRTVDAIIVTIQFLHALGVYHIDIKWDNLLINSEGEARAVDFGLSVIRRKDGPNFETYQLSWDPKTVTHLAPELAKKNWVPNEKIDVFSIGQLVASMLRTQPFSYRWYGAEKRIEKFVNRMIETKPEKRPTLSAAHKECKEIYEFLIQQRDKEPEKKLLPNLINLLLSMFNDEKLFPKPQGFSLFKWLSSSSTAYFDYLQNCIKALNEFQRKDDVELSHICSEINILREKLLSKNADGYLENLASIFDRKKEEMKNSIDKNDLQILITSYQKKNAFSY